jgi:hypothetical protein
MTHTEADFDRLSWHDCHIWGVALRAGDPDAGDWTSELALDLDFIVEWICGVGGGGQFRVAPATLVFQGVTDPKIDIDWGRSGFQASLHPASIATIERELIRDQKVYLDRPYYRWRIRLNWPDSSEITFGAAGFTQTLRAEPILTERQCLSLEERDRLGSGQDGGPSWPGFDR